MKNALTAVPSFYSTKYGSAYLGDALELLKKLPSESIDLICTSPPFALLRQKSYGNFSSHEYVEWFMHFAREFRQSDKNLPGQL